MKIIRFHPKADAEMVDAAVWYETQQENLGKRFLASVQDALNRIEVNPVLSPLLKVMSVGVSLRHFHSASFLESNLT